MSANELPVLWSVDDIAAWRGLSKATVMRKVVTLPGFPKPLPGSRYKRQWFKAEVIEFMEERRAA